MGDIIVAYMYLASIWFFATMWEKAKDEKYQYFYMFLTFIHVIGGLFIALAGAPDVVTADILRPVINLDLIMLFATIIIVIATGTEKGVRVIKMVKNRMKELST